MMRDGNLEKRYITFHQRACQLLDKAPESICFGKVLGHVVRKCRFCYFLVVDKMAVVYGLQRYYYCLKQMLTEEMKANNMRFCSVSSSHV